MSALRDALRLASTGASILVLASFCLFVADEGKAASERQLRALGAQGPPSASTGAERAREGRTARARELLEDANDVLLGPFAGLTDSSSPWVRRLTSGIAALLVYGIGLRVLAGYLPAHRAR